MLFGGHSGTNPKSTIACRPGLETIRNAAARHSKFLVPYIARKRVRQLFTTSNRLTADGQDAIRSLCAASAVNGHVDVSAHHADCDRVPLGGVEDLAKAILRSALKNHERDMHPWLQRAASA